MTQQQDWKVAYYEQGIKFREAKDRLQILEASNAALVTERNEWRERYYALLQDLGEAGMAVPSADSRAQA